MNKEIRKDPDGEKYIDPEEIPGTGALCAEAQADGVPCTERGRDCAVCEKAALAEDPELTNSGERDSQ